MRSRYSQTGWQNSSQAKMRRKSAQALVRTKTVQNDDYGPETPKLLSLNKNISKLTVWLGLR
jgi:hypothetical protein